MSKFYDQIVETQQLGEKMKEFMKLDREILPAPKPTENLRPGAPSPSNDSFNQKVKNGPRSNNGHGREKLR